MRTDADTVVPFGPITSKGRVKVVVEVGLFGLVFKSMVAVAVLLGSATLVALSVTVCAVSIVLGAVYTPLVTVPSAGLNDHVTAVSLVPETDATNPTEVPETTDAELGPTFIEIEFATGDADAGVAAASACPELRAARASAPLKSGEKTKVVNRPKDRRMSFARMFMNKKAFFE